MFEFAGKHHDLLDQEEKNATFGIFSRKPTAVMILPGLTPVFRRFVKEVDDLIPKTKQTTSCIFQKPAQKPTPKPVSSSVATSPSSSIKEVTIESITMRMENWLEKEKQKHPQINISIEEGMKKFSITLTENGRFKFKCKHQGCSEVFMLTVSSGYRVVLSNVQRHITKSCWLSSKSKQSKLSISKNHSKLQTSLIGKFKSVSSSSSSSSINKVKYPDGIDFDKEPPSKILKSSVIDMTESSSDINEEDFSNELSSSDSKNLLTPAGQPGLEGVSGC